MPSKEKTRAGKKNGQSSRGETELTTFSKTGSISVKLNC